MVAVGHLNAANNQMYIIDNKKVDMTAAEYKMYEDICFSYNRPNFKGSELFVDLFSSDNKGMITGIRPPSKRHTSFEIIIFLFILMNSQQLRLMHKQVNDLCADLKNKVNSAIEELKPKA